MRHLLALLFVVLSGCAFQSTQPVHHLESGEVVITAALTEPGFLYVPKLFAAATVGAGGVSDFTVGAGTALVSYVLFGIARFYSGWFETSVEANYQGAVSGDNDLFFEDGLAFLTVTPRVGFGLTKDQGFNGGLQGTFLVPTDTEPSAFLGAYGSYAWRFKRTPSVAMQVELAASPLILTTPESSSLPAPFFPFVHLNVGVTFWPARTRSRDSSPPREEENETPRPLL